MFLEFKKIEHTEEWVLMYQQKVEAFTECFLEVKKNLPRNTDSNVIYKITIDLINSTNDYMIKKYEDYYLEKTNGNCENS